MPLFIPKKMKVKEQSVLWSLTQYPHQREVPVVKYMLKVCNLASHIPFVPVVLVNILLKYVGRQVNK